MISIIRILALSVSLFALATPADASGAAALRSAPVASAAVVAQPAAALVTVAQGLPMRAPEPRTLHEFWPVFALFVLSWIGIAAYVLSFGGRLRRLANALERVEEGGVDR